MDPCLNSLSLLSRTNIERYPRSNCLIWSEQQAGEKRDLVRRGRRAGGIQLSLTLLQLEREGQSQGGHLAQLDTPSPDGGDLPGIHPAEHEDGLHANLALRLGLDQRIRLQVLLGTVVQQVEHD